MILYDFNIFFFYHVAKRFSIWYNLTSEALPFCPSEIRGYSLRKIKSINCVRKEKPL